MRRFACIRAWRPAFLDHLPDVAPVVTTPSTIGSNHTGSSMSRDALLPQRSSRQRQSVPLSLRARTELAERSNDIQYHVVTEDWFGQRVDDFVMQHHPEWSYESVKKLVQQGHIYRYRRNGKKRYTRLTDRLEFDELVVVPTHGFWQNQITAPSGVELDGVAMSSSASSSSPQHAEQQASGAQRTPGSATVSPSSRTARPRRHLSAALVEKAREMVLFKNEHVIVINKPSGVPMMPTANPLDMNIADMLPAWQYTYAHPPLVCHNLDSETSGCVVLARSPSAHRMLGRMFVKRVVPNSVYWGFCVGKPVVNFGRARMHCEETTAPKGGGRSTLIVRPSPTAHSRVAIAEFVVNASALEWGSFVSFYPLTTRRHQERIIAAHALRCPLLGDATYGGESAFPQSLALVWDPEDKGLPLHLHHRKVQLPFKKASGQFVCVTAPVPAHMERTFARLGWPCNADDPLIPG